MSAAELADQPGLPDRCQADEEEVPCHTAAAKSDLDKALASLATKLRNYYSALAAAQAVAAREGDDPGDGERLQDGGGAPGGGRYALGWRDPWLDEKPPVVCYPAATTSVATSGACRHQFINPSRHRKESGLAGLKYPYKRKPPAILGADVSSTARQTVDKRPCKSLPRDVEYLLPAEAGQATAQADAPKHPPPSADPSTMPGSGGADQGTPVQNAWAVATQQEGTP